MNATRTPAGMRSASRGFAAIEFAFVLLTLFAVLYGVTSFGAVFYTQQALVRAAEDGARAVQLLPNGAAPDVQRVRDVVHDSLAASLLTPLSASATLADRRSWIASHVVVAVTGNELVVVSVRYPYRDNALLPTLPLMDAARWMPSTLLGRATLANPA